MPEECHGYIITDDGHFSDATPLTILDARGAAICAVPAQEPDWSPEMETGPETWALARRICAGLAANA